MTNWPSDPSYRARQIRIAGSAWVDRAKGAPKLRRHFRKRHGYDPDFRNPRSFCEKIQWRKLHDRQPILARLANKLLFRGYVEECLGKQEAERCLVPLLYHGRNPERIPFDVLPERFVIKATHGSGMNLVVGEGDVPDRDEIRAACRHWLATWYKLRKHEWLYARTRRGFVIEPLVEAEIGASVIEEMKLHMFDGKLGFLSINRYLPGRKEQTYFGSDGALLDLVMEGRSNDPTRSLPDAFGQVLELAERLSAPLDYIRVDFLLTRDGPRVGELTSLHQGGMVPFRPQHYDWEFGNLWKLPR